MESLEKPFLFFVVNDSHDKLWNNIKIVEYYCSAMTLIRAIKRGLLLEGSKA